MTTSSEIVSGSERGMTMRAEISGQYAKSNKKKIYFIILLLVLIFIFAGIAATLGSYDISFIEIINKDMIASEIVRALAGSIGLTLAIPITVLISASLLNRKNVKTTRHRKV